MATPTRHALPKPRPAASAFRSEALLEHLPCVVFELTLPSHRWPAVFSYVSAPCRELLGLEPEDLMLDAAVFFDRIAEPQDALALRQAITEAFTNTGEWRLELRVRVNNELRWFSCQASVHRPDPGSETAYGYLEDITARRPAEPGGTEHLPYRHGEERQLRLWASVLQQSTEGIVICDQQRRIVAVNPAFETITGFTSQEAIGRTPAILHSGLQDRSFYERMWQDVRTSGQWRGEIWNRRKDGRVYVQWMALTAVHDPSERVTHYVSIFSDITQRKDAEERMRHLSEHDALTDLPNRIVLQHRLDQLIDLARRSGQRIAVLFLDLDRFKSVNDSLGHEAGDRLLQIVAQRLQGAVRQSDTVSRLGGDEFVILLNDVRSIEDALRLGRMLLKRISEPMRIGEHELSISASIGLCLFPEHGDRSDDLLRNADAAMYEAKSGGRNRCESYARVARAAAPSGRAASASGSAAEP